MTELEQIEIALLRNAVEELTNQRDAYAKAADDMAASHKVERDELATTLAAIEIKVDALIVERRAISEGWNTANKLALQNALERDAIKDAARLALDAIESIPTSFGNVAYTKDVQAAIAALKAVL